MSVEKQQIDQKIDYTKETLTVGDALAALEGKQQETIQVADEFGKERIEASELMASLSDEDTKKCCNILDEGLKQISLESALVS